MRPTEARAITTEVRQLVTLAEAMAVREGYQSATTDPWLRAQYGKELADLGDRKRQVLNNLTVLGITV